MISDRENSRVNSVKSVRLYKAHDFIDYSNFCSICRHWGNNVKKKKHNYVKYPFTTFFLQNIYQINVNQQNAKISPLNCNVYSEYITIIISNCMRKQDILFLSSFSEKAKLDGIEVCVREWCTCRFSRLKMSPTARFCFIMLVIFSFWFAKNSFTALGLDKDANCCSFSFEFAWSSKILQSVSTAVIT